MAEPHTVAELFKHMQAAVDIPGTVMHRCGIDDCDSYQFMAQIVQTVADSGCTRFIVHARTAWLQGLSPKKNREIPPLRYDDVYRLKQDFPELTIEINGGIETIEDIKMHLQYIDGVMVGRAFYHNPYLLAETNSLWNQPIPKRSEILAQLYPHLQSQVAKGEPLSTMARHYLGLFQGLSGARKWRQALSGKPSLTIADIEKAADEVLLLNPDAQAILI